VSSPPDKILGNDVPIYEKKPLVVILSLSKRSCVVHYRAPNPTRTSI